MGRVIRLTQFEPYQKIKPSDFPESIPFYEKGKPPRHDLWLKQSFLDEEERVFGKKWGESGIGKLREVLLCRPVDPGQSIFKKDPVYYMYPGGKLPDVPRLQEQHDALAKIYKDEGIDVNYMEYPPIGPYGPIKWMIFTPREPLYVRGGAIIQRTASHPYARGREIYLMRALTELGCPILYTVHGTGVFEIGASFFIAENVFFTGRSIAYNEDGLEQVTPVLRRAGIKEIVVNHIPGPLDSIDWPMGGTYHPDMFCGVIDIGLVIVYPPWCAYETIEWLREHKFKMIEIPAEEQRKYLTANTVILEPGKVVIAKGAKQTIAALTKEGVECIEHDYTEFWNEGGGIRCATGMLARDPGPSLEEIMR